MSPDTAMREAARRLGKTLLFFDLETTGTSPANDRIVEIAIARATPDEVDRRSRLVNPGCPIPKGAADVHGITDEMVADAPSFSQMARSLHDFIADGVFVAYNGLRFDLPLLEAEFKRAGVTFDSEARDLIDPFIVFTKQESRDLASALRFYCDEEHDGAHRGDADIDATAKVLLGQMERYEALPTEAEALAAWCLPADAIDRGGWFAWRDGHAVVTRGKHANVRLEVLDPSYLSWMSRLADLPTSTMRVVADALEGRFPKK